jgi:hypothetical protein
MTSKEIEAKVTEIQLEIECLHETLMKEKKHAFIDVRCKRLDVMHRKSDVMLSFQIGS